MLSKRTLQQLIDLARTRSDSAARTLGATHGREREEHSRLELLMSYREECLERFRHAAREGVDHQTWTNYQKFVVKLDAAIVQQQELLAQQRQKTEQCRTEWRAANGKLKSFHTLDERRQRKEKLVERRREQRQSNEVAARKRGNGR